MMLLGVNTAYFMLRHKTGHVVYDKNDVVAQ